MEVPLLRRDGTQVGVTHVDLEDAHLVVGHTWRLATHGYATRRDRGRVVLMHRVIVGLAFDDEREVDHINRDPLDNRRSNLRVATHAENMQNRKPHRNGIGMRGVYWRADMNKWRAAARINGRFVHIGYFDSPDDARAAASQWRATNMPFAVEEAI